MHSRLRGDNKPNAELIFGEGMAVSKGIVTLGDAKPAAAGDGERQVGEPEDELEDLDSLFSGKRNTPDVDRREGDGRPKDDRRASLVSRSGLDERLLKLPWMVKVRGD